MKNYLLVLLLAIVNHASAFSIKKPVSLVCTNVHSHKKVIIKPNTAITIWYKNEQNIVVKVKGFFKDIHNEIIEVERKRSGANLFIPINSVDGISRRRGSVFVWNTIAFALTTFLMGVITQLLVKVDKSNKNPNGPNYGNGIAGVIGIVGFIFTLPLFVLSGFSFIKQISWKPMKTQNGWQFTEMAN